MSSLVRCKHCRKAFRRSKEGIKGRSFCSMRCYNSGEKITVLAVWRKDHAVCDLCGRYVPLEEASRDHRVPRFNGGKTIWTNISLAHRNCNSRKGHMSRSAYISWWNEKLLEQDAKKKGLDRT